MDVTGNVSLGGQLSENWELYIVASIYLTVFTIYIVPYLICIYVIIRAKDLTNKPYYQILLHMSLADVIQIFNSLFSCVFTLARNREPFWCNKLAGAMTDGCWFFYCCLAHILAINRFVSMYYPLKVGEYFSIRRTRMIIGVAWAYGAVWIASLSMPGYTFMFFIEFYTWDYADDYWSSMARRLNLTSDMFHLTVLVVWYTLIFVKLRQKLRQVDETLQGQTTTFVLPGVRKREILVLFQASVLCLMVVFTIVGFYLVPMFTDSKWAAMAMNIVWISTAGMNALVYIAFNSRIRQDFKAVLYRMVGKKQAAPFEAVTTINAIARKTCHHTTKVYGRAWT